MSNKKKKIAIIINSLEGGGAERVASNVLLELHESFDFHLILLNNIVVYELPKNQKTFILNENESPSHVKKILQLPFLAKRYKSYLEKNNIHISLSFMNRANFVNGLLKTKGWKGKTILSEQIASSMEYPRSTIKGRIGRFLIKRYYQKVDLMLATSEGIKRELKNGFNITTPCQVINNPVNLDFIENKIQSEDPVSFDKFTFINVGRFQTQKNHTLLLEAFGKLKDYDCQLILLGDGYLRSKIEEQITRLAITDKVIMPGFVSNPYKFLKAAQCFVLSSLWEGFPNVVLEALACGIPVVSTDCPTGPREILLPKELEPIESLEKTDYGFLVPSNDSEKLFEAFKHILKSKPDHQAMGVNSKKRAKHYDVKKIMKQFEKVLHSA